ncbi:glycerophosphodiester phosphodiesterase family protein [Microbacterium sp. 179-B 1A2 NHS]|uniref:glycerophosphodiester phosphodiesterase family protein n=1 Tax=Microbacterium sp. 179-B 1A2 NHS TaxID=3142383 RepID=UPI0039A10A58
MTHPWFMGEPGPRVLAHRGFVPPTSEGVAENSVAAIAAARGAGTVYIESDCHLTADGEVVLFHDDDLRRVTGDPRPVASVPARELAAIMSTRGGLAMLADVLDAFPDARFNLDVKAPAAAEQVGWLVARESHRVLLTSFSDERRRAALTSARAKGGDPATSAGTSTLARILAAARSGLPRLARAALAEVDALQVPERHRGIRIVTPRLLQTAHRAGVEVHVWTVNEPADMRRLIAMGVDGIVTDHADRGIAVARGRL